MLFRNNSYKKVFTDGAVNEKLGICGLGAVFFNDQDHMIEAVSEFCPLSTNNQTEYQAVIMALKYAIQKGFNRLKVYTDSQTVVQQVIGLASVKSPSIKNLHHELILLLQNFKEVDFIHIPRCENEIADALANRAIDIWKNGDRHGRKRFKNI